MTRTHGLIVGPLAALMGMFLVFMSGAIRMAYASSSVPGLIHYQANLATAEGLLVNGPVAVRVVLFDSETLGSSSDLNGAHVLYAEDQGTVRVERGVLRFTIGEGSPVGPFAGAPLPLESLAVAEGIYAELLINGERIKPRQKMVYHNAALRAQYAKRAQELSGEFRIVSGNLPDLPASKVAGQLSADRIPDLDKTYLKGGTNVPTDRIPPGIPVSKISGALNPDVIPDIPASRVTSGQFDSSQMPSTLMPIDGVSVEVINFDGSYNIPPEYVLNGCSWLPTVGHPGATPAFGMNYGIDTITVGIKHMWGLPIAQCKISRNGGDPENCLGSLMVVCAH